MMTQPDQLLVDTQELQPRTVPLSALIEECTENPREAALTHRFLTGLSTGEIPREGYVEMLAQFYILHHVLENHLRALRARRPEVAVAVHDDHFQEVNLRHDLVHFRRPPCSVRRLPATLRCTNLIETLARKRPLTLLGFHYAMEALKPAARQHAPGLRAALSLPKGKGTCYLERAPAAEEGLPDQIQEVLDSSTWTLEERCDIVEGARLAYESYCALLGDIYYNWGNDEDDDV